jgi:hypothetical protein
MITEVMGMTQLQSLIKRFAEEEMVYVDETWNWHEVGEKSKYALVELDHCISLEVPSVWIYYCKDEQELVREYAHHTFHYERVGHRTFFVLVDGQKAEAKSLIS